MNFEENFTPESVRMGRLINRNINTPIHIIYLMYLKRLGSYNNIIRPYIVEIYLQKKQQNKKIKYTKTILRHTY